MKSPHRPTRRAIVAALAACSLIGVAALANHSVLAGNGSAAAADPLLDTTSRACAPSTGRQPILLKKLVLARTETAPFQPVPAKAAGGDVPLLEGLGTLTYKVTTSSPKAQACFDQGVRLAYGFNHAEAQRAFREAQRRDPRGARCFWGEAFVLGPNINAPMDPAANARHWTLRSPMR